MTPTPVTSGNPRQRPPGAVLTDLAGATTTVVASSTEPTDSIPDSRSPPTSDDPRDNGTPHPEGNEPPLASQTVSGRTAPAASVGATEETAEPEDPATVWLRRGDQIFVGGLLAVCGILLVIHALSLGGGAGRLVDIDRLPATAYEYRLDVNSATWVEWAQLEGLGETLARRIVEDREAHGPFQTIDDVGRVKGIGPKTLIRIKPWLEIRKSPAPGPSAGHRDTSEVSKQVK